VLLSNEEFKQNRLILGTQCSYNLSMNMQFNSMITTKKLVIIYEIFFVDKIKLYSKTGRR